MSGKALEALTGPKTVRQIRLPFFYGWLLVGVSFVTMAIGVNAPPILCCSRKSSMNSGGIAVSPQEPSRSGF
jgi:hypothetical protein